MANPNVVPRWKPGQSGNPAGRPSRRSLKAWAHDLYEDPDREASIRSVIKDARKGRIYAIEFLAKLLGETAEPTPAVTNNFFSIVAGDAELLRRLSAAYATAVLSAGDPVGVGEVREPGYVEAVATPDADQRRAAENL